mgnify:CR=1 FL=1
MIKGIVERRTADRIPFETALQIKFTSPGYPEDLNAYSVDISAGGMKFAVTSDSPSIPVGEELEFDFNLPNYGQVTLTGKVTYRSVGSPQNNLIYYGVKFLKMDHTTWKAVIDYCYGPEQARAEEKWIMNLPEETPQKLSVSNQTVAIEPQELKTILHYQDGTEALANLEDISFGGARVSLYQPLPVNTPVTVTIRYAGSQLVLNSVCVWSTSEPNGTWIGGLFFNALNDQEFSELTNLIHTISQAKE